MRKTLTIILFTLTTNFAVSSTMSDMINDIFSKPIEEISFIDIPEVYINTQREELKKELATKASEKKNENHSLIAKKFHLQLCVIDNVLDENGYNYTKDLLSSEYEFGAYSSHALYVLNAIENIQVPEDIKELVLNLIPTHTRAMIVFGNIGDENDIDRVKLLMKDLKPDEYNKKSYYRLKACLAKLGDVESLDYLHGELAEFRRSDGEKKRVKSMREIPVIIDLLGYAGKKESIKHLAPLFEYTNENSGEGHNIVAIKALYCASSILDEKKYEERGIYKSGFDKESIKDTVSEYLVRFNNQ